MIGGIENRDENIRKIENYKVECGGLELFG